MRFSQRHGYTDLPESLDPEAMPSELRNSLWNVFYDWRASIDEKQFLEAVWRYYLKEEVDSIPRQYGPGGTSFKAAWDKAFHYTQVGVSGL
jgi:hypothetical protein